MYERVTSGGSLRSSGDYIMLIEIDSFDEIGW